MVTLWQHIPLLDKSSRQASDKIATVTIVTVTIVTVTIATVTIATVTISTVTIATVTISTVTIATVAIATVAIATVTIATVTIATVTIGVLWKRHMVTLWQHIPSPDNSSRLASQTYLIFPPNFCGQSSLQKCRELRSYFRKLSVCLKGRTTIKL